MIICAQAQSECFQPVTLKERFYTSYDCLQRGYMESQIILKDIGEKQVNKNKIIVKFTCQEKHIDLI